jgi:hypothetical protein
MVRMLKAFMPVVMPIAALSICFASFYSRIRLAKKKVKHWKGYSTYWFVRSNGLFGVENRAKWVWMKEEGYDEAEALMLAEYQSQAIFLTLLGNTILFFAVWAFVL